MSYNARDNAIVENIEEIFTNLSKIKGDNYVKALQILMNQFTFFRLSKKIAQPYLDKIGDGIIDTNISLLSHILNEDTDALISDYWLILDKVYGKAPRPRGETK